MFADLSIGAISRNALVIKIVENRLRPVSDCGIECEKL